MKVLIIKIAVPDEGAAHDLAAKIIDDFEETYGMQADITYDVKGGQ